MLLLHLKGKVYIFSLQSALGRDLKGRYEQEEDHSLSFKERQILKKKNPCMLLKRFLFLE